MAVVKAIVISLIALSSLFSKPTDGLLEISLKKYQSARELMYEKGTTEEHLKMVRARQNDSIALYKYLDSDYYAIIGIGHPAQIFKVIIDTAWANSWIPSKLCPLTCMGCVLHNKYDSSRSSTYQPNGMEFVVHESMGDLKGFLSTDNINIGHIKVENQTFAEATNVPWQNIFTLADGVLGFAFKDLAVDSVMPIFYNIYSQNLIEKPVFSIYINRDTTTDHAGVVLLGGDDPKHYNVSSLFYLPVSTSLYWEFKMTQVTLHLRNMTYLYCANGCQAVIDSSTSIISGPYAEIMALNGYLKATKIFLNRYQVECSQVPKMPKITITIGKTKFILHGRDIVQQMTYEGATICLSVFVPIKFAKPRDIKWVLGGSFMRRAYVIFDMGKKRIGFAHVK